MGLQIVDGGGGEWWDDFFEEESPKLMQRIYYILHDCELASELAQEVFVKHLEELEKPSGRLSDKKDLDDHRNWIRRVAKNMAINQGKAVKRRDDIIQIHKKDLTKGAGASDFLDGLIRDEDKGCVLQAMSALPDRYEMALRLKHFEGWGYPQIADELDIKEDSVGRTLSRARNSFKKLVYKLCPDLCPETV